VDRFDPAAQDQLHWWHASASLKQHEFEIPMPASHLFENKQLRWLTWLAYLTCLRVILVLKLGLQRNPPAFPAVCGAASLAL
jgi:hypothetical protein